MIPLFKSHYSIGKSILTIDDIFSVSKELDKIVVVEDSFYGFRSLNSASQKNNKPLVFGIRLPVVQNATDELASKLIFFAKSNKGITQIKNLYSKCFCSKENLVILSEISADDVSDVQVGVPFYDSFIYNNIFHFGLCHVDLSRFDYFYFYEKNNHPFDQLIYSQVEKISNQESKSLILSKSIYYLEREDLEAFQMYKAICNRSQGKSPNFGNPNLNHFCSSEFCWQSFSEYATL